MKTITILKKAILLVAIMLLTQFSSYADNYYAYKNKSVTINGGGTFAEYKWILVSQPNGTTNTVITDQTGSALTQTFTAEGTYKLRVIVRNTDGCWSDVDETKDIDIFVLPDFTVTVATDGTTPSTYCTNAEAANRTTLKATAAVTGTVQIPTEVTITLADWYKTAADGILGTLTPVSSTNPYLLTETTVGTHYFVATGKYNIPTGRLISSAADPVKSTVTSISITAAPTTPTITPVITNSAASN